MVLILKKYLTGAGVIALAFSYNISQANSATCFTPPTCDELGYTTDLASCNLEEYMTCPFDANKVYCPDCETGCYRLTKEQCDPTYGTCVACPYDNTRYKYSKCNSPLVKSNNVCICSGGSYPRKKIEEDGGNTCTDARGTWSSGTGCWTNAKVSDGEKCVRQKMSMGQVFMWGGLPIGFVLSDDGESIRVLGTHYLHSTSTDSISFGNCSNCTPSGCSGSGPSDTCYLEYPRLNATELNGSIANSYTPQGCSQLNTSPNAYHPGSQYDPICHVSGSATWRVPTRSDTVLIGQFFDWMMNKGTTPESLVYSAVGGGGNMTKWFPTYAPAPIGPFMMYDDTGGCGVSGAPTYMRVNFGNGTQCEIDNLAGSGYDVDTVYSEFNNTSGYAQGRYPIRPVMVIAIQ